MTSYYCKKCNQTISKWVQTCPNPACKAFNMIAAGMPPKDTPWVKSEETAQKLSTIVSKAVDRISSGTREFDRVLGGGLVIGSAVLISGDPGIGKSTLLLQVAIDLSIADTFDAETGAKGEPLVVLYVSAEETNNQIKGRADRLSRESKNLYLYNQADIFRIEEKIGELDPDILIIDSIQTMIRSDIDGQCGSLAQVRECAAYLVGICKARDIACFMVAHVNKEGVVAGPKTLEHLVDATLEFHKEGHGELRSIRASKNRFGDTNEMALFRMCKDGLISIENPSELLLEHHKDGESGVCIGFAADGPRPLAVEVQTLLHAKVDVNAGRRFVTGLAASRVAQVMAVLTRKLGVEMNRECYVSIAGGLEVKDPGLDLPLAISLVSSALDYALPESFCAYGEIGLAGEIRPVSYSEARVKAATLMNFKTIMGPPIPRSDPDATSVVVRASEAEDAEKEERYIAVSNLEEVFEALEWEITRSKPKKSKRPKAKSKTNGKALSAPPSSTPTFEDFERDSDHPPDHPNGDD